MYLSKAGISLADTLNSAPISKTSPVQSKEPGCLHSQTSNTTSFASYVLEEGPL